MFRKNVQLNAPLKRLSTWRKTSLGTWKNSCEASIYSLFDIDAEPLLQRAGSTISIPAMIGKAASQAITANPMINSIIRFGRIYPRKEINVFFQVFTGEKEDDLSGVCIKNCDQLSVEDITQQLRRQVVKIRKNTDEDYTLRQIYNRFVPGFLARWFWGVVGFIQYTLNFNIMFHHTDYFGSVMISSISHFDIDNALAPLLPFTRCPAVVTLGTVREKVVVENGELKVKKIMTLGITLDHRLVDGAGAARLLKVFKEQLGAL